MPALLRRLADVVEKLGPDQEVWNVFIHRDEVNEYGDWPQATVYHDTKTPQEDGTRHLRAIESDR